MDRRCIRIKLPPKEKIPEAYTAIEDHRIKMEEQSATVKSSNFEKEYLVTWNDNTYYSNDAATYWQGYLGYPVIAVLMLQNKLPWNKEISSYFKQVNWNKINKENKRDYKKSLEYVLANNKKEEMEQITKEIDEVYEQMKKLEIKLTRKK